LDVPELQSVLHALPALQRQISIVRGLGAKGRVFYQYGVDGFQLCKIVREMPESS